MYDTRGVTKWIQFESQVRNLAAHLHNIKETKFVINEKGTFVLSKTNGVGKVNSPSVDFKKSVLPEAVCDNRWDCSTELYVVKVEKVENVGYLGEIVPKQVELFTSHKLLPEIVWKQEIVLAESLNPAGLNLLLQGYSVSGSPEPIQLNIKFAKKNTVSVRKKKC